MNDLIYVYCLSNNPRTWSQHGQKAWNPCLVIFTIVKYVPKGISEENFKEIYQIFLAESNAREHIRVISDHGAEYRDPFKFGTIFIKDSLKKFLRLFRFINRKFPSYQGKEEWSVKIYCDRESLCEQIDELSEKAGTGKTDHWVRRESISLKRKSRPDRKVRSAL